MANPSVAVGHSYRDPQYGQPVHHKTCAQQASRPSTTTSQKTASSGPPDPYYGHEPVAKLAGRYVTDLFACPALPPQSAAQPTMPSPPLAVFIAYALHRTRLHPAVTFAALYLLQRLKDRFPAARGSSGHRLFLSAFMIASKVMCDDTYSNKSWCIVGQGMFALREVNQMEREMCSYLDWELNIRGEHLEDFERQVRTNFAGTGPFAPVVLPTPPPRLLMHTESSSGLRSAAMMKATPLKGEGSPVAVSPTAGPLPVTIRRKQVQRPQSTSPDSSSEEDEVDERMPSPSLTHSGNSPPESPLPRTPTSGWHHYGGVAIVDDESLKAGAIARAREMKRKDSEDAKMAAVASKTFVRAGPKESFAYATGVVW